MSKRTLIIIAGIIIVVCVCIFLYAITLSGVFTNLGSNIVNMSDQKFGDQHFKTTVALVELHHIRHGVYPADLSELEYIGDWDMLALSSVEYFVSESRSAYCITVTRGWIGQPDLTFPSDFFNGTGFKPTLCP
jgi:hypothetical protein